MTTTTIRITAAARILADLVDEGIAAGLPEPYSIQTSTYAHHRIAVDNFAAVEAWAAWLNVSAEVSVHGDREFCEALAQVDGITVEVSNNRALSTQV